MSSLQDSHVSFQYLGADYNLHLSQDQKSKHSVIINGISYAVLGDEKKLADACKILNLISLDSVLNKEELKGRLSFRQDIALSAEKAKGIGITIN